MTNEEDLRETTGGGFDRGEEKKPKGKFFKSVGSVVKKGASATGKGAKYIGTTIAKGSGSLAKKGYESYKAYNTPEAKQARLDAEEVKLERQVRIAQQKQRIRKLQPPRQSGGGFGGFGGIDIGNIMGGSGGGSIGNPNAMNNLGGGMGGMGNLNSAMSALGGTQQRPTTIRVPKRYRTVKTKTIKYKRYKPKGSRKYKSRRVVSYKKRRVAVKGMRITQPKVFDPFSQF